MKKNKNQLIIKVLLLELLVLNPVLVQKGFCKDNFDFDKLIWTSEIDSGMKALEEAKTKKEFESAKSRIKNAKNNLEFEAITGEDFFNEDDN